MRHLLLADSPNQGQCDKIVSELKVWTNSVDVSKETQTSNTQLLNQMRKFEEDIIIYSIKTKNFEELENAYKRLRFYNEDLASLLSRSENQERIAAIYLLYLLSFNRFSDFHIELEKISEELQQNQFILFPIKLEQWIAIGSYSNVLEAKKKSPLTYFNVFLERILETLRYEISRSAEKAYERISLAEAQKMFLLNSSQELKGFIQQEENHGKEKGIEWKIEGNYLHFIPIEEDSNKLAFTKGIPDILSYANELEKIV